MFFLRLPNPLLDANFTTGILRPHQDGRPRPAPGRGRAALHLDSPRLPDPREGQLAAEGPAGARDLGPVHGEIRFCWVYNRIDTVHQYIFDVTSLLLRCVACI